MIDFISGAIDTDYFGNNFIVVLYSSSVLHYVYVDDNGDFLIDGRNCNFTDVEYYSLINVTN